MAQKYIVLAIFVIAYMQHTDSATICGMTIIPKRTGHQYLQPFELRSDQYTQQLLDFLRNNKRTKPYTQRLENSIEISAKNKISSNCSEAFHDYRDSFEIVVHHINRYYVKESYLEAVDQCLYNKMGASYDENEVHNGKYSQSQIDKMPNCTATWKPDFASYPLVRELKKFIEPAVENRVKDCLKNSEQNIDHMNHTDAPPQIAHMNQTDDFPFNIMNLAQYIFNAVMNLIDRSERNVLTTIHPILVHYTNTAKHWFDRHEKIERYNYLRKNISDVLEKHKFISPNCSENFKNFSDAYTTVRLEIDSCIQSEIEIGQKHVYKILNMNEENHIQHHNLTEEAKQCRSDHKGFLKAVWGTVECSTIFVVEYLWSWVEQIPSAGEEFYELIKYLATWGPNVARCTSHKTYEQIMHTDLVTGVNECLLK